MNHQPSSLPCPATSAELPAKARAILQAATELFMAQGYGAVSMDAVAKQAGVSKATLYAHYRAKDRLFAAIVEVACASLRNAATAELAMHEGTLRSQLMALGRHWLRFLLSPDSLAIFRTVVAESPRFPELAASMYENGVRATREWMTEWLAARRAAGELAAEDPAQAAREFLALLRGDLYLRASLGITPSPDEAAIEAQVQSSVAAFCRIYGIA